VDAASVYLGRKLLELIDEKQAEMSRALLMGKALDFPDYKERAGYLRGLYDVGQWMAAISTQDEQREMRP
jgi:hypothetical protein